NFRTWTEVLTFVNRFYADLPKIRSTDGWNVTAWCDFRNFMDQTFADAVLRPRRYAKPKTRTHAVLLKAANRRFRSAGTTMNRCSGPMMSSSRITVATTSR